MTITNESNTDRELIKILRVLAPEFGLTISTAFTDWVIRLAHPDGRRILIFGYDFGLNSSSSAEIARDKGATSHLLREANVPCLEHRIVFRPDWAKYTNQPSTYEAAFRAFKDFGEDVVCKNNKGTGGIHVFRARAIGEVEQVLSDIFDVHYACTMSPFLKIDSEVRVILIDGHATAVFSKQRPETLGDGTSTFAELVAKQHPDLLVSGQMADVSKKQLLTVPDNGEARVVNWRHNLGQGAAPNFDIQCHMREAAVALACKAVEALGLRAASVDIVWSNGDPRVMEVNSGIMVESLSRSGDVGRGLAMDTYRALIRGGLTVP